MDVPKNGTTSNSVMDNSLGGMNLYKGLSSSPEDGTGGPGKKKPRSKKKHLVKMLSSRKKANSLVQKPDATQSGY